MICTNRKEGTESGKTWKKWLIRGMVASGLLVVILVSRSDVCKICSKIPVNIYHGPYATYTPVDLQVKCQNLYSEKFPWYKTDSLLLRAKVVKKRELGYKEAWLEAFEENIRDSTKTLFSINSYIWMVLAKGKVPCDTIKLNSSSTSGSGKEYHLIVIGHKKTDRPYYLLRFITHKGGHFPVSEAEFSDAVYMLNEREESGSTHVTPEVYLLENCTCKLPQVIWEAKNNMVRELVADKFETSSGKRRLIGAISDSEYTDLLDDEMRDSLIVRDVMVNIPHDPIVVIQEVWKDKKKDLNIVCRELEKAGLITKKKKRTSYLQEMYRYYVSLGILRKDERGYYIHDPQRGCELSLWGGKPERKKRDTFSFYRTVYGNLEDHYYRFEKKAEISLVIGEDLVIINPSKELESLLGCRVYPGTNTPVDDLIEQRNRRLY